MLWVALCRSDKEKTFSAGGKCPGKPDGIVGRALAGAESADITKGAGGLFSPVETP